MKNTGNDFYEVQSVVGKKRVGRQVFYRIKWKGYSQKESTWQAYKNVKYCQSMIEEYEKAHQDESSSAQNKPQSMKQKYISIASESDDIQVHSKEKEGQLSSNQICQVKRKRKKTSDAKTLNSSICNSPTDSIDKSIMIHSSCQAKQPDEPKKQRRTKQPINYNQNSDKINRSRTRHVLSDKKANQNIIQDDKNNELKYFNFSEKSILEKSNQEQKSDIPNQVDSQQKSLEKDKNNHKQKLGQRKKNMNTRHLAQKNKKVTKKQALKLKKVMKQTKTLKEPQVSGQRFLSINSKQDAQMDVKQRSIKYLKNIHEVIAYNKKSDNIKVQLQNNKDIQRIRLIQSQMFKEIRDYVIQYTNGEVKIFNTISLFANYPLQFIEYLQGKNVFLK